MNILNLLSIAANNSNQLPWYILWLIVVVIPAIHVIISKKTKGKTKLGWILITVLLPLLGYMAYLYAVRTVVIKRESKNIKILNTKKLIEKDKIYDVIFFIGGTFLAIVSLAGGYYSSGGTDIVFGGYSSSAGFSSWAVITLAIGISMIVMGFLRRSWRKQKNLS